MLTKSDIEGIIPHRDPFLLIDSIIECEAGKRAVGVKHINKDDAVFAGHFPGYPVFPGVLIVEAMAQTGAVALLLDEKFKGKIVLFAGIDKLRFKRQVHPPAELRLEVEIQAIRGPIGRGMAKAFVGEELAAQGQLTFAIQ